MGLIPCCLLQGEVTACSCAQRCSPRLHTPSASHPQGNPVVAQRARIVPSATTSPACILCLGQIDLSIWIVINPHTTSATRFRTLCNVTRKLVRWRLGFHEQRPYYIGISSGCRQSPVRTLTYRRMRLHAGGALVV